MEGGGDGGGGGGGGGEGGGVPPPAAAARSATCACFAPSCSEIGAQVGTVTLIPNPNPHP